MDKKVLSKVGELISFTMGSGEVLDSRWYGETSLKRSNLLVFSVLDCSQGMSSLWHSAYGES